MMRDTTTQTTAPTVLGPQKGGGSEKNGVDGRAKPSTHLMAKDADIARAARCLKALAHPLRLKILCTLGNREISVQEIVEQVGTTQSNISQHLAILRDKGILAHKKVANRVYYYVDDERTLQLIRMMQEVFCKD
jgi:DNA-binding transcriptional ArsR family regulator